MKKKLVLTLLLLAICTGIVLYKYRYKITDRFFPTKVDVSSVMRGIPGSASVYNLPKMTHNSGNVIIQSNTGGGLQLLYQLDPNTTYQLKLSGKTLMTKTPTLELDLNNAHDWISAPKNGNYTANFTHIKKLGLLIYNHGPIHYLLHSISVKKCPGCNTNQTLKAKVLTDNPKLNYYLKHHNTLKVADILTNWVANHSPTNIVTHYNGKTLGIAEISRPLYSLLLTNFQNYKYGIACAGMAQVYANLLNIFGLNTIVVGTGIANTYATHVYDLIPVKNKGKWSFYVFDPTFNLIYRSTNTNNYATLHTIINSFKNNQFKHDVNIVSRFYERTFIIDQHHNNHIICSDRLANVHYPNLTNCFSSSKLHHLGEVLFKRYQPTLQAHGINTGEYTLAIALLNYHVFGIENHYVGNVLNAQSYSKALIELLRHFHISFGGTVVYKNGNIRQWL